jgi:hypothetical protein
VWQERQLLTALQKLLPELELVQALLLVRQRVFVPPVYQVRRQPVLRQVVQRAPALELV